MAINTPTVTAYNFIVAYIRQEGGDFRNWYTGIAADIRQRLFGDHRVSEQYGKWAYYPLTTDDQARDVENALLALGCQGDKGGGDKNTRTVYVYRITSQTLP